MPAASHATSQPQRQPLPAWRWVRHDDAAGFSVRIPLGWRVQASSWGEIAISEPGGSAAVLVRTRKLAAGAGLEAWLRDDFPATEPGLHNVRLLEVQAHSAQLVRAAFDYGSNVFQGSARMVAVREENLTTLFVAAAARAEFAQRQPALVEILDSLRYAPGPGRHFHHRLRQAGWSMG